MEQGARKRRGRKHSCKPPGHKDGAESDHAQAGGGVFAHGGVKKLKIVS